MRLADFSEGFQPQSKPPALPVVMILLLCGKTGGRDGMPFGSPVVMVVRQMGALSAARRPPDAPASLPADRRV